MKNQAKKGVAIRRASLLFRKMASIIVAVVVVSSFPLPSTMKEPNSAAPTIERLSRRWSRKSSMATPST